MVEVVGSEVFLGNGYSMKEYDTNNGPVLAFCYLGHVQSLIYKDKSKKNEICYDYFNFFDLPVSINPSGNNYLVLGGGILSYPRYYISHYRNKNMDVVEINGDVINYAKKYFYLDQDELNNTTGRLNIIIDDAVNYISFCQKKYDYILIDLFTGNIPVMSIYNYKSINDLKRIMNDNGIIAINYIISDNNKGESEFLKILYDSFKTCKIISKSTYFNKKHDVGNIMIFLSNDTIDIPSNYAFLDLTDYFINM